MCQQPSGCPTWSRPEVGKQAKRCESDYNGTLLEARQHARSAAPSHADIARWHRSIFQRVVPLREYAGGFRQKNAQPCLEANVGVGGVSGADCADVVGEMQALSSAIAGGLARVDAELANVMGSPTRQKQVLVTVLARIIGDLIRIHPFINGNGRAARLLWSALLARYGYSHAHTTFRRPQVPAFGDAMGAAMRGDDSLLGALILVGLTAP